MAVRVGPRIRIIEQLADHAGIVFQGTEPSVARNHPPLVRGAVETCAHAIRDAAVNADLEATVRPDGHRRIGEDVLIEAKARRQAIVHRERTHDGRVAERLSRVGDISQRVRGIRGSGVDQADEILFVPLHIGDSDRPSAEAPFDPDDALVGRRPAKIGIDVVERCRVAARSDRCDQRAVFVRLQEVVAVEIVPAIDLPCRGRRIAVREVVKWQAMRVSSIPAVDREPVLRIDDPSPGHTRQGRQPLDAVVPATCGPAHTLETHTGIDRGSASEHEPIGQIRGHLSGRPVRLGCAIRVVPDPRR